MAYTYMLVSMTRDVDCWLVLVDKWWVFLCTKHSISLLHLPAYTSVSMDVSATNMHACVMY